MFKRALCQEWGKKIFDTVVNHCSQLCFLFFCQKNQIEREQKKVYYDVRRNENFVFRLQKGD